MVQKSILITVGLVMLVCQFALASSDNVLGRTYPIAEKDALQEIEDQAKTVDWKKAITEGKKEAVKKYQPPDLKRLPRVEEAKSYLVDMSYTLEIDVPDGKGGILYPKGYRFNPLDYMSLTSTIVVIDATDPDQTDWFRKSSYSKGINTKLLLSDGNHHDTAKDLGRPVFYLNDKIASRFNLQAVPSVVAQNGRYMEVRQIDVDKQ
jgi:conjugal transfer pilus assembly protein TraW